MAHPSQRQWCEVTKYRFPDFFDKKRVLDVGSLDINGSNKDLFTNCEYIGIDVGEGKNVDVVCKAHEYKAEPFDVIISTECFEHDQHIAETLPHIITLLKPGGLFVFTCATEGRLPHGCEQRSPQDSPLTMQRDDWNHSYYRNLTANDVCSMLDMNLFKDFHFNLIDLDIRFYGIKK
jgi:SAM-dependent methyltransferase